MVATWVAERARVPGAYGAPRGDAGLLEWGWVVERMVEAPRYWVSAVNASGAPVSRPVDGVWLDDTLYFGGSPETSWVRALNANPEVSVHLESGVEVVILEGRVAEMRVSSREFAERLVAQSKAKFECLFSTSDAPDSLGSL